MDEKLTCKVLWGFGIENYPEDIKTKLILDYEKLYYEVYRTDYEMRMTFPDKWKNADKSRIRKYQAQMQYIDYLFKYIYNQPLKRFVDIGGIEKKVERLFVAKNDKNIKTEDWIQIYNENGRDSIKFNTENPIRKILKSDETQDIVRNMENMNGV